MFLGKTGAVPKEVKKTKKRAKAKVKESKIQADVEDMLDSLGLAYIRIPDSIYAAIFGNPRIQIHIKSLISSFIKGVPDITILLKDGRYICIELKTDTGKQSQGQKTFEKKVGKENYFICRSKEDVCCVLRKYGIIL